MVQDRRLHLLLRPETRDLVFRVDVRPGAELARGLNVVDVGGSGNIVVHHVVVAMVVVGLGLVGLDERPADRSAELVHHLDGLGLHAASWTMTEAGVVTVGLRGGMHGVHVHVHPLVWKAGWDDTCYLRGIERSRHAASNDDNSDWGSGDAGHCELD